MIEHKLARVQQRPEDVFEDQLGIFLGGEDSGERRDFLFGRLAGERAEVHLFDDLRRPR